MFSNFILVVKVVLSATTISCLTVVSLVFVAIVVISLNSRLLVLIVVLVFLLSLDLGFRSRIYSTEISDLTIHGLQKLILLEVVVVFGVHSIVSLSNFCRLDASVPVDVKQSEDSTGVYRFDLSLETSALLSVGVLSRVGSVFILIIEFLPFDKFSSDCRADDSVNNGCRFVEHARLCYLFVWIILSNLKLFKYTLYFIKSVHFPIALHSI